MKVMSSLEHRETLLKGTTRKIAGKEGRFLKLMKQFKMKQKKTTDFVQFY